RSFNWLSAAAVILLFMSAGLNFYFYNNWKKSEGNLLLALNQQQEIAGNFDQAKFDLKKTERTLHILKDWRTKRVDLQHLKNSESEAVIYYQPESKMVLLEVKKLPAAPPGKQYQLWALTNGKP